MTHMYTYTHHFVYKKKNKCQPTWWLFSPSALWSVPMEGVALSPPVLPSRESALTAAGDRSVVFLVVLEDMAVGVDTTLGGDDTSAGGGAVVLTPELLPRASPPLICSRLSPRSRGTPRITSSRFFCSSCHAHRHTLYVCAEPLC